MQKSFKTQYTLLSFLTAGAIFFASCGSQEQKPAAEKEKFVLPDTIARSLKIDTAPGLQAGDNRLVPVTGEGAAVIPGHSKLTSHGSSSGGHDL